MSATRNQPQNPNSDRVSATDDIPLTNITTTGGRQTEDGKNAGNRNSPVLVENGNDKDAADQLIPPSNPAIESAMNQIPEGINVYRNKKTLTQGLMDIALFSANANQLRYIIDHGDSSQAYFYIVASLIIISLILQIAVGLLLLLSVQYNLSVECQRIIAYQYGNYVVICIFLITVVNVFIAAFGGPAVSYTAPSLPGVIPRDETAAGQT